MGQLNSVPELAPDLFAELLPEENTKRAWQKRRSIVKAIWTSTNKVSAQAHRTCQTFAHSLVVLGQKTDNLRISNITSYRHQREYARRGVHVDKNGSCHV